MFLDNKIVVGVGENGFESIDLSRFNRHGFITGATGTGKTVTLRVLGESLSDAGVPVIIADVKGDLSATFKQGEKTNTVAERIERLSLENYGFKLDKFPTVFWDILGNKGLKLRTTISEFGPLLLSAMLGLNQTQSEILNIAFKIADDEELLIIDTKDLKSLLNYINDNSQKYKFEYGNIAKQSVAAIIRSIVSLEDKGADRFFGEPAFDINDWIKLDMNGKGYINILESSTLINDGMIYSMFMLWLLSELFELMPEVGDINKPKFVFFFDEAHLLFKNASKELLDKMEQVVKLIRSKGIGIYFITQSPKDIPDFILAQLGNKIQHALRAYTPNEQKAIRAAAMSYRENPAFNTEEVIKGLGIGEAVCSFIMPDGQPSVIEKITVLPPQSYMGSISEIERQSVILASDLRDKYEESVDRDSAYEFLQRVYSKNQQELLNEKELERKKKIEEKEYQKGVKERKRAIRNVASTTGSTIGREMGKVLGKSVGGSFGKRLGGNIGSSLGRGILKTLFKL